MALPEGLTDRAGGQGLRDRGRLAVPYRGGPDSGAPASGNCAPRLVRFVSSTTT